jgi:hypothetical protein
VECKSCFFIIGLTFFNDENLLVENNFVLRFHLSGAFNITHCMPFLLTHMFVFIFYGGFEGQLMGTEGRDDFYSWRKK